MNILHLCNKVPFPGRDGSSIAMESLINLEVLAGHTVHVVALNTNKHRVTKPTSPIASVNFDFFDINLSPSLIYFFKHCFDKRSYFASRFFNSKVSEYVRNASSKADLIVVDSMFMSVYRDFWGNKPFIIRTHNVEHQIWERTLLNSNFSIRKIFTNWQTKKLKKWEIKMLKGSRVWAITEEDAKNLHELGIENIDVYPCTFNPNLKWRFSGSQSPKVYHLGALDWEPNILGMNWFIETVLPKISLPTEITVFSRKWPKTINIPEQVIWNQSLNDIILFDDYGIFIAPLLSGSGMRIKLLEAMARGKAIVTTSIGGEGLKCIDGEHILLADTADEFAKALSNLILDTEFRVKMGKKAREHVLINFSEELFKTKMKNIVV